MESSLNAYFPKQTLRRLLLGWLGSLLLSPASAMAEPPAGSNDLDSLRGAIVSPEASAQDLLAASVTLVTALLDLAQDNSSQKQSYHAEATALITQALPVAESEEEHKTIAELLRLKWFMQFQQNKLDGQAELLLTAMKHLEKAKASEAEKDHFYTNLYFTFILAGDYLQAITFMRRNVVNNLESGNLDALADDFYNIGDAYLKIGELDIARRYFQQSQLPYTDPNSQEYIESDHKLATVERLSGNPQDALNRHLNALSYFQKKGSYRAIPAQIEIAKDYIALGELSNAAQYANRALSDPRIFDEQELDVSLVLLEIALLNGTSDQGQRWIDRIAELIESNQKKTGSTFIHPTHQIKFATLAMAFYQATEDSASALPIGESSLGVYQHIRTSLSQSGDSLLAWTAQSEPFISQYLAVLFTQDPSRILDILEDIHSSSLLASNPTGGYQLTSREDDKIRLLNNYLEAETKVVDATMEADTDPVASQLHLERAKHKRDQAREEYLLGSSGLKHDPNNARPTGPETLANIADGDVFLRYYTSQKISFLIILDQHGETIQLLPEIQEIESLTKRVLPELTTIGVDARSGILTDLSRLLPVQLLSDKRYQRIIIVPDALTHPLPFAAINIGGGSERYVALGDPFEVLRTYSIYGYLEVGIESERAARPPGPMVTIFADPNFATGIVWNTEPAAFRDWSDSLQRLPFTAQEAREIAALYGHLGVITYLGSAATSEALMSESSRSARVLHIASHGYFNDHTPDIVGIATSAQSESGERLRGFLGISELMNHEFYSSLIVISGCETMLGRSYKGLGVRGLSQGFISQGAGAVLGTLWKIPDKATSEFMRIFYSELLSAGGNAPAALHQTRLQMMNSPEYSQPGFWAAFALTSTNAELERNVFE